MRVEHTAPDIAVAVPREVAAAALRNLLENARWHTSNAGPVAPDVRATPDHTVFMVSNHGDWPAGESTQRLIRRFWRQDRARSGAQGSGLGSAIVAAIADCFHGRLDFTARDADELVARLSLPRDPYRPDGRH